MTTIRKQSIISSGVVYIGLALGALSQYLLARTFTPGQYGLITGMFVSIGTIISFVAAIGMPSYIMKFYPYYKDHLPPEKNDMMGQALLVSLGGLLVTISAGIIFRKTVIDFYEDKSAELVQYYYWIFPFGLGLTLFSILEAYGWQLKRSILTSYLREIQFRITTLALTILFLTGVLGSFDLFVKLYAFNYLLIALMLMIYLLRSRQLHFSFTPSRVTKKFFTKIRGMALLAWGGNIFFNVSFYFAQIVIAGLVAGGLTAVGIFTLAQFISSLIQAPQRAVGAAAIGPLSRAWKDKDHGRISRIYQRSAINQLIFSAGMFVLIWINFRDGILVFHLNTAYLAGQWVFFFLGLARVIDLGTGVNSQVIGTSIHWRFELYSGMILVALTIPLNYLLAKKIGLIGPAVADLITLFIYNGIRWLFLYRKYRLQPFDWKSVVSILLAAAAFALCDRLFGSLHGLLWMFARSAVFIIVYVSGVLAFRLSEDLLPVWETVKKRVSRMTKVH
jgi:O-antigen/teichoic acid export membrane protein